MSTLSPEFYWLAVALLVITSTARFARLLTFDKFPPLAWLRGAYEDKVGPDWGLLMFCGYCISPYIAAVIIGLGWWAGVFDGPRLDYTGAQVAWFAVTAIFGGSYLGAILMKHDGDDS